MTILYFVIALGVLVFIHEFGHFLAAKKQGIGVEKFSLGFGPKLFGFRRGETDYLLSALPFGGYVKLHGEEPSEKSSTDAPKDPRSYSERPVWQRCLVVFAGPLMNLLLAALVMPVVFLIGRMEPVYFSQKPVLMGVVSQSVSDKAGLKTGDALVSIGGEITPSWRAVLDEIVAKSGRETDILIERDGQERTFRVAIPSLPETPAGFLGIEPANFIGNEAVIDGVFPDSPAAKAGLQAGDEIVAMDGSPIGNWTEMSGHVSAGEGRSLQVRFRRGGEEHDVTLTPQYHEGKWLMGVQKDPNNPKGHRKGTMVFRRHDLPQSITLGFQENIKLSRLTVSVLGRLVTFRLSYKALGGPIRIAQASAAAAEAGLPDFLYFLCFLSLQLGILNLLPLPVLDGGHLFFFAVEGVQRRPLTMRVRQAMEQAGFVLLVSLMLLVTWNDVDSIWGLKSLFGRVINLFH